MGGRFWLGLPVLLSLGGAVATADDGPPAATAAAAADEPTAVTVVSGDTVALRTTSGLLDTLTGRGTPATGTLLLAGECPPDIGVAVVAGDSQVPATVDDDVVTVEDEPKTQAATCLVTVTWDSASLTVPGSGHLVVAVDGLDDAVVAYDLTRTTGFDMFVAIAVAAVLYGAVGASLLWSHVKDRNVPDKWTFKEGWATALTGLTAGAAGLFGLTGVLDEYAPQYSLAGVLAANLIVAVLVLSAPMVFSAFGGKGSEQKKRRHGFVASGAVSLVAAAAQIFLIALVIVSGSTNFLAKLVTWALAAVVLGLVLWYAKNEAATIEETSPSAAL